MSDGSISQDEIDALLSGVGASSGAASAPGGKLSSFKQNALTQFVKGNIPGLASNLESMTGKTVTVSDPVIELTERDAFLQKVSEMAVATLIDFSGAIEGDHVFVLSPDFAKALVEGVEGNLTLPLHRTLKWTTNFTYMHKTKKALIERLKSTDMVIEMLDARLPRMQWLALVTHKAFSRVIRARLASDSPALTARELEVLRWTADGKSAQDIAEILLLSKNTVDFHIRNSIMKLDAPNKTAAVVRAVLLGLFQ